MTKLFTTAAALWKLGGHHVWRTPVAYRGTLQGDRLDGDLWILGRGAPDLVEERLWIAAQWIAERGLSTVTGEIVTEPFLEDLDKNVVMGVTSGASTPDAAVQSSLSQIFLLKKVHDQASSSA